MKSTNFRIKLFFVPVVLASSAMIVLGATKFIPWSSGNGSTSTLVKKQLSQDTKVEGIVAVTQTLIEEANGERRAVRVVVFSMCLTKRGRTADWVTGQKTVPATGRAPAEISASVGGVPCRFKVQPSSSQTWDQVTSLHDLEVIFPD